MQSKILPGQYYDAETNLHYNYFRDYDPSTGRYIESDPIGLSGGLNTYGYVGANPTNYIDPHGLIRWTGTFVLGNLPIASKRSPYKLSHATLTVESDCDAENKKVIANYQIFINEDNSASVDLFHIGSVELFDINSTAEPTLLSGNFSLELTAFIIPGFGNISSGGASGSVIGGGFGIGFINIQGTSILTPGWEKVCCD